MNQEEAHKCLAIARRALQAGDGEKAERFARKAVAMHPSPEVTDFLALLQTQRRSQAEGTSGHEQADTPHRPSTTSTPQPHRHTDQQHTPQQPSQTPQQQNGRTGLHHRHVHSRHQAAPPIEDPGKPEEKQLVAQILNAKDLYSILGVAKTSTDDDIKKAYRKLALKLHPDKNRALKADEAFKAVGKAFACLSDPDKRAFYDRTGHESSAAAAAAQQAASRQASGAHYYRTPGGVFYSEDFDPDEVFRMFFGGMGPSQMHRQRAAQRPQRAQGEQDNSEAAALSGLIRMLVQLLPFLLIMFFTLFANYSKPAYSLAQDEHNYPDAMLTMRLEAPFFVRNAAEFERAHPRGTSLRHQTERQIEGQYVDRLQTKCDQEKAIKHRLWTWGQREEAKRYAMASCEEIDRIRQKLGYRTSGTWY